MLSGETASGKYPVEAVKTMARIALTVEQSPEYRERARNTEPAQAAVPNESALIAPTISRTAYDTALALNAKAIVTPTMTGTTARLSARYRPPQPILAITPSEKAAHQLLLDWGVFPCLSPDAASSDAMLSGAQKVAVDKGFAAMGDRIVLAAGFPVDSPVPLNTVRVFIIGNVLCRAGRGGFGKAGHRAGGRVFRADNLEEAADKLKANVGDILVCPVLSEEYIPVLRMVKAVVSEGPCEISDDKLKLINPELVWLTRLHNASHHLENGLGVTVDGRTLLVYEGNI
jgi:pyruvate kinase